MCVASFDRKVFVLWFCHFIRAGARPLFLRDAYNGKRMAMISTSVSILFILNRLLFLCKALTLHERNLVGVPSLKSHWPEGENLNDSTSHS